MKVGLVLEGGALRGLYTAGVLDVMMENNIDVDAIIGTSAGALFGVNYFSNQRGRVLRYNLKYASDIRYISKLSLILTGNIVNKKFAYYKVSKKLDIFNNDEFKETNKDYFATVTNIETGLPEYIKVTDPIEQMEVLRASSAMPLVSKIVEYNGKKYLDGAITDSIPINNFLGKYDKIIVVLTQPIDYKKQNLSDKQIRMIKNKYKKYPLLIERMIKRPDEYNEMLDKINELEQKKKIFVIRPSSKLNIDISRKTKSDIERVYNIGVKDCNELIESLKKYLEKEG